MVLTNDLDGRLGPLLLLSEEKVRRLRGPKKIHKYSGRKLRILAGNNQSPAFSSKFRNRTAKKFSYLPHSIPPVPAF
jgi:hypothetical protein